MFKNYIPFIKRNLSNLPGWHTNRKIVVFESDDWGSIRMPSKKIYRELLGKNIRIDRLAYNRYDSLASVDDLSALFQVLLSVKDKNGSPAVLTANTIVANPDFKKIRDSNYAEYYYEPFPETLKHYPAHSNSFELWKQGISEGIFKPQFHGREHINVTRWMRSLREDVGNIRLAFEYGMFDLSESEKISENSFMEAFNFEHEDEITFQKHSIIEGLNLFERLFGYKSSTFIAPCYIWSNNLNQTLFENGVSCFQGNWYQFEPIPGKAHKYKKSLHFTGQKNALGQLYMTRNGAFEPSQYPNTDFVGDVLARIEIAFRWKKPAIIGTHRLNFIGFIDQNNRDNNLKIFSELLKKIVKQWPDVEFMSSDQLGIHIGLNIK